MREYSRYCTYVLIVFCAVATRRADAIEREDSYSTFGWTEQIDLFDPVIGNLTGATLSAELDLQMGFTFFPLENISEVDFLILFEANISSPAGDLPLAGQVTTTVRDFERDFRKNFSVNTTLQGVLPTGALPGLIGPGTSNISATWPAEIQYGISVDPAFFNLQQSGYSGGTVTSDVRLEYHFDPVPASNFVWNDPNGGLFSDPGNWEANQSPGGSDSLLFDLANSYEVEVDGVQQAKSVQVKTGAVTFDFSNGSLSLSDSFTIGAEGETPPTVRFAGDAPPVSASASSVAFPALSLEEDEPDSNFVSWPKLPVVSGDATLDSGVTYDIADVLVDNTAGAYARLHILDDAVVRASAFRIGDEASGIAEVFGATSQLETRSAVIGDDFGSNGTVEVGSETVSGGLWDSEGELLIGNGGKGTLNIRHAGSLRAGGPITLGDNFGSEGTLLVSDQDSRATFTELTVGSLGKGELFVGNGGKLTASAADARLKIGGNGQVALFSDSANKSEISANDEASLHIDVSNPSLLQIGENAPRLLIGRYSLVHSQNMAVGSQVTQTGDRDAIVEVNGDGLESDEFAELRIDDRLILHENGELRVGPNGFAVIGDMRPIFPAYQTVTITAGGSVGGTGTIRGHVEVEGGAAIPGSVAVIRPGDSPGVLTVDGNANIGGILEIEIGGTTAGSTHDVMNVLGDLTIEGVVRFAFIGGFSPTKDDTFEFLMVGGASDLTTAGVEVRNLAPGFAFDIMELPGGGFQMLSLNDGTFVPEQSTLALALFWTCGALHYRRRRPRTSR